MSTKIIATIGPATVSLRVFRELIAEGMNIARINTKYGSDEQYQKIRENCDATDCELMYDIKGLTKVDWLRDIKFDYLAVSDAETPQQIEGIRTYFEPRKLKIISKIETQKGIDNIDELIKVSDGIMVARGDMGKNIPFEHVPIVQKIIIKKCNEKNKMVITATEMLLSMTESTIPERAEASDVANAILDGSDAVMLSEETSVGKHPILAVRAMKTVVTEIEKNRKMLD